MKLTRLEIRNFRSIFEESSTSRGLELTLADGLNVLVGRNNCGKSNLFRATALALDPNYDFQPGSDVPGPKSHRYPSVQLWFDCNVDDPDEQALLRTLRDYEHSATDSTASRADENEIVFRVAYAPDEEGGFERRERFVFRDGSDEPIVSRRAAALPMLPGAVEQFRSLVRFVMVSSGESIASVLEGNFREILHSVVQERMSAEFAQAEQHRSDYIKGLEAELLGPLRELVTESVTGLFPEITDIHFEPDVSDIESTLSKVRIALQDAVSTPLAEKGTGLRSGVLVAMLQYLARNTNRCVVMAIEEPEAFLHPAAQEDLRGDLEVLAKRDDVSVLVTTHSPFVVSRSADAMSFFLDKDHEGRTRVAAASEGDDERVKVISGIVREESMEELLSASQAVGPHAKGVLMVEGYGDKEYLELAVAAHGRRGLLHDIEIIPTGGTTKMLYKALVASAASGLPVAVLHDADAPGLKVRDELGKLKNPETSKPLFPKQRVISYSAVMPSDIRGNYAWEAEDVFDSVLIEDFVEASGGLDCPIVLGHEKRPTGLHVDMDHEGKRALGQYLIENVRADHCERWLELVGLIRKALGLPEEPELPVQLDTGDKDDAEVALGGHEPAVAGPSRAKSPPVEAADEQVLIVSKDYGHADYLARSVFDGEPGRGLSPSIRYVGFYERGEIRTEIPQVLSRHDDLVFTMDLAERLVASTDANDRQVGEFIKDQLETGRRASGDTRQIFLLTSPDDANTIHLDQPIKNTKLSPKGKPMAWVVRHKLTWKNALVGGVTTTDELDQYEGDD